MAKKKATKNKAARKSIKTMVEQVKEPFSLLETLKEEGMANAGMLLGMMAGAAKSFRVETIRPQLKEVMTSLGFAMRSEVERLEVRLDELETRISELDHGSVRSDDEE